MKISNMSLFLIRLQTIKYKVQEKLTSLTLPQSEIRRFFGDFVVSELFEKEVISEIYLP